MLRPDKSTLTTLRRRYEKELFEHVIPFWMRHSPDREHGGYFNCLDRDGKVFDTTKHVWLQGRQVWMFSKLYRTVEARPEWLDMANLGMEFLRKHAILDNGQVAFALTADGRPAAVQRKIFSACFLVLALSEFGRAADRPSLVKEAHTLLERIWHWIRNPAELGKPAQPGEPPSQSLAVPMILLNLMEELSDGDNSIFAAEVDSCLREVLEHVDRQARMVRETVAPDGSRIDSPAGRLLNPGHAIEAGWFMMHWAKRLGREELVKDAVDVVRWSHALGWDKEQGGIFYFLDSAGFSPTQLEWNMKLWWPHCEALYAHLLNFSTTMDIQDWQSFLAVDDYAFSHFRDPEFGEWYGYLDRQGRVTHRFKGGPYKGCFHVPRALLLCWRLLRKLEEA